MYIRNKPDKNKETNRIKPHLLKDILILAYLKCGYLRNSETSFKHANQPQLCIGVCLYLYSNSN